MRWRIWHDRLRCRGAISLWLQRGGSLYWVTTSVATGFVAATANAWVLLVKIKR
jgi:hypothetical protein